MKKYFVLTVVINMTIVSFSQNQNNNWYFGQAAGVTFNSGTPQPLTNGVMYQNEGTAVMSDNSGNLLFFTDGVSVWNRNLVIMPNGTGLLGNISSTQSALIVPEPGSCNVYYIFTVPAEDSVTPLSYSIVDMSLNGGLGDISSKNISLHTPVTERLTGTLKSDRTSYWVVAQEYGTNGFLSFSVTSAGVNTTPVFSYAGPILGRGSAGILDNLGYMKISPDGSKLSYANLYGSTNSQLFDFSNTLGIVSNNISLLDAAGYGVEFSSDNSKVYIATGNAPFIITQYDLSDPSPSAIQNSHKQIVYELYNSDTTSALYGGALELGPDNKIYCGRLSQNVLSVINQPNLPGMLCGFADTAIILSNTCEDGLPNNIKSLSSPCILPLTLENFQGVVNDKSVRLLWNTTNEENTESDVVERSYDGTDFSVAGSLPAKGSALENKYEFTDEPSFTNGIVFYRLKFIDKDGKYTYSKILRFPLTSETSNGVKLFPNPANDYVQVTYFSNNEEATAIRISDLSGRTIMTRPIISNKGINSFEVNIDGKLPAGIYILQLTINAANVMSKLIVK